jgi:AcrR family transcriptional regulator
MPATARRRTRKPGAYHHGDLRRALLDATLDLIGEHGPEGFTLRAAAQRAGVSDAAPYHHFSDKRALLLAVAAEGFDLLRERMEGAADEPGLSPLERARRMGRAYVLFAAAHPSHFRVMASRMVLTQTDSLELARAGGRAFALVQQMLLQGLHEAGGLADPAPAIFGSWALVHGLAFLAVEGHLGPVARDPAQLGELVDRVMQIFER